MPLIENDYKQKFFTIESTLGVGEIKSNLTISQLKKSLENLKNIKQLRLKTNDKWIKKTTQDFRIKKEGIIKNGDSFYVRTEQNNKFDSNDPFDQIFTFIICKDFDTKLSIKKILTLIRDMKGRDKGFGINSILSLNKGLLCYNSSAFSNNRPEFTWIPFMNNKIAEPIFLKNKEENNDHIKAFCAFVYEAISGISLFHTQMTNYFSFNIDVDQVINLP